MGAPELETSDMSETPEQICERLLAPLTAVVLLPATECGSVIASLDLLESLAAAVLGIVALPAGEAAVLATFAENTKRKLALVRLEEMQPLGSG
jgi:hypothetical protein